MQSTSLDAIVLGLGAMGSASLYQLAARGKRVLGIDRFTPPHRFGSSHGDTRITRQAIGEGDEYVPLVLRSHEIWRELEQATGRDLLTVTGGLIISSSPDARHHGVDFFQQTVDAAAKFGIEHTLLDAGQIARRFPQFKLEGHERGYFEDGAGFIRPEVCIEVQISLAKQKGADVHTGETVLDFTATGRSVRVRTDRGSYEAERLLITAGPWVSHFLGERYKDLFRVYRQVLHWFDADLSFFPPGSPVFIWELGAAAEELIYGFPAVDGSGGGVKVATDDFSHPMSPDDEMPATPQEAGAMYERYLQPRFNGLGPRVLRSETCFYTLAPDYRFVIDRHPEHENVVFASACSGHGFKHSAAIGEALAELVTQGKSSIDISPFSLNLA